MCICTPFAGLGAAAHSALLLPHPQKRTTEDHTGWPDLQGIAPTSVPEPWGTSTPWLPSLIHSPWPPCWTASMGPRCVQCPSGNGAVRDSHTNLYLLEDHPQTVLQMDQALILALDPIPHLSPCPRRL